MKNIISKVVSSIILIVSVLILSTSIINAQTMIVNEIMFKPGPTVTGCDQKLFVNSPNSGNPQMSQSCGREYIELYNSDCDNDYDMSGYILGSCQATSGVYMNGGAFVFPAGTIVPAGGFLTVGGPDEDDGGNGTFTYTIGSIDIKLSSFTGTTYIATTSNGFWFLPNVDGWMALYEPNGNVHSAVYWSSQATNITSVAEFEEGPPSPAAYTGPALKSAKAIYQTTPALIEYVGVATATNTGNTLSRIPDGGAWQPNRPSTVGPSRSQRCNDGTCLACGNLTLTPISDTCSAGVGTITLTIPSPTTSPAPYTYTVSGPNGYSNTFTTSSNPHVLTGLDAGSYSVTVVDNFTPPNTTIRTTTIDDVAGSTFTTSSSPDNCNTNVGSATITVSGGLPPYTYSWSGYPANNAATLSNIPAGTYNVTVSGNNGTCPVSTSIIVANTGSVTATVSSTNDICSQHNGTATVTPNQPVAQCTFLWSPGGQTTQTASNLTAGNYTCTVTYNGCSTTATTTVTASGTISATISGTNPLCSGAANGSVTVTVSQGQAPYTYNWSNSGTNQTINNVGAGSYSVTITTSQGCSTVLNHTLTNPAGMASQITQTTHVSCFNGSNGNATVVATGGTAPYTFNWSNQTSNNSLSNVIAGNYIVTITDNNNCTTTNSVQINQPTQVTSSISSFTNVSCYNGNDGSATVSAQGGTPSYTYNWENGQHGVTSSGLTAGQYAVVVADANNCTSSSTANISNANPFSVTIPEGQILCSGNTNGSLTASVSGGQSPYTYLWNTGSTGSTASDLSTGTYSLLVTDNNGCTTSGTANITSPEPLVLALPADLTICPNATYEIIPSVTGGTHPYNSYYWNNTLGSVTYTVNNLQYESTYTLYVTDVNGCVSNSDEITISLPNELVLTAQSNISSVCPGDPVIIAASTTGGIGSPYTLHDYNGNLVTSPFTIYPINSGQYSVTVEDGCGTTDVVYIPIQVYTLPTLSFYADITEGCVPLTVQFIETNPTLASSVVWNFGDSPNLSLAHNPSHTYREGGTYSIEYQYTSLDGCKSVNVVPNLITAFPKPDAKYTFNPPIASIIKPEINFYNQSQDAFSYQWHFGDGDSSNHANPSHFYRSEGDYIVELIAISSKGCKDTAVSEITISPEFTFFAPSAFSPNGDGINDYFHVSGHGINPNQFKLMIYDRWGEVVYETSLFNEFDKSYGAWDGKIKGHSDGSIGTYTYLVIYYTKTGIKKEIAGTVSIVK